MLNYSNSWGRSIENRVQDGTLGTPFIGVRFRVSYPFFLVFVLVRSRKGQPAEFALAQIAVFLFRYDGKQVRLASSPRASGKWCRVGCESMGIFYQ